MIKTWCFFSKKVSDWKYLRESKNDSFIFFQSIEPIQDIDSFFSKDFLHWSNKKNVFLSQKKVVDILFLAWSQSKLQKGGFEKPLLSEGWGNYADVLCHPFCHTTSTFVSNRRQTSLTHCKTKFARHAIYADHSTRERKQPCLICNVLKNTLARHAMLAGRVKYDSIEPCV